MKNSGIGRDEGLDEILSYTECKTIHVILNWADRHAFVPFDRDPDGGEDGESAGPEILGACIMLF